ncbi:SprT family protein [Staphylococcus arlettae]|uniref:SprT family protein n=1 Tax=Staphylococcus arlettae TaxID=29378 RepID=UPI00113B93B1|nr:SprT family protein [Staphylococcus arlettae]MCD9055440.1 SprT family protein [Staphylococcus arlettae]UXU50709.1 SprT family protein [Staphylococcus arlettae]UXU53409.1 SprT family protein [Staphylococcus arlettae]BBK27697.1 protein SprT [Staphylococcus arlettae]
MQNNELQSCVEKVSLENFNKPFKHRAYFNNRLRTTGGRYLLHSHNIEINYKQYTMYGMEALTNIIKHELCHYHLHLEGKGYKHKDYDFKKLSKQVNAPRYCEPLESYESRANYIYECTNCKTKFMRIRKVNTRKMVCSLCHQKLTLIEKK